MYEMDGVPGRVILQSGLQQQPTSQQPVLVAVPGGRLSPSYQGRIVDTQSVSPVLQLNPLGSTQYYNPSTGRTLSPVMGMPTTTVLYTPSPSHVSLQPAFPATQTLMQTTKGVQMQHQLQPPTSSAIMTLQQQHLNNPNVVVAGQQQQQQHPSTSSINSVNIGPAAPTTYSTFVYAASSPSGSTQQHLQQQYLANQQGLQGQHQYLQQNPNAIIQQQQETTQLIVIDPMSLPSTFQDRMIKMDYIRKVLSVLFTQVGLCFLIVNIFNIR